ncbi:MAG: radical SAM protein, partial [Clostridium sp.]|nr:radical SAM protein [Clostridium sp.]
MRKNLGIYLHIPFCVRKCAYCDFLSAPAAEEVQRQYVEALKQEIVQSRKLKEEYQVATVFFGGGTPSLLPGEALAGILEELRKWFCICPDAEITVECNPGTLTEEKLAWYRKAGVNRLSMGLQSAQNQELKLLGRIHTWEEFLESFRLARAQGFANLNVDLMSA